MRIHLFAALLLAGIVSTQTIFSQITITAADMPDVGDVFTLSTADTLLFLDPAPTGADFTWDFSSLGFVSQTEVEFVAPSSTNFLYFLLWATSDAAATLGLSLDLGGVGVENIVQFFSESSSQYAVEGFGGEVSGAPVPVIFDQPDVLYTFPMNYGNIDSGSSSFGTGLPGIAEIYESATRTNEVDGWGTLITPFGTFDVLRLKSTVMARDSIVSSAGDFVVDRIATEYKWLGAGNGLPLLQIDVQDIAGVPIVSNIIYQDSIREPSVGLEENDLVAGLQLYPNPASGSFTLEGNLQTAVDFEVSLRSLNGQLLQSLEQFEASPGFFRQTFSLPSLSEGLYFIELRSQNDPTAEPVQVPLFIKG